MNDLKKETARLDIPKQIYLQLADFAIANNCTDMSEGLELLLKKVGDDAKHR